MPAMATLNARLRKSAGHRAAGYGYGEGKEQATSALTPDKYAHEKNLCARGHPVVKLTLVRIAREDGDEEADRDDQCGEEADELRSEAGVTVRKRVDRIGDRVRDRGSACIHGRPTRALGPSMVGRHIEFEHASSRGRKDSGVASWRACSFVSMRSSQPVRQVRCVSETTSHQ